MPPWGWWPLAFVGVAILDRLLAHQSRKQRFTRAAIVAVWWLFPATFWMWDFSKPGWVIQGLLFAALYGLVCALAPRGAGRRIALPGALVLAALVRWNWPFGGAPLATLAISQADAPLAPTARIFGSLTIVALVGVGGVALSAVSQQHWRSVAGCCGVLGMATILAWVAPSGTAIDTIEVAVVQGGGQQRTRAVTTSSGETRRVFERHVEATRLVEGPVDFVLWPENVVITRGPLQESTVFDELVAVAQEVDAPVIVGIIESFSDEGFFLNASVTINPDGTLSSRYDKLRRVPFGEYVPFRSLIERVAPTFLPSNDAKPGTGPAIIETGVGTAAISISWEVFHDDRTYSGMRNGGLIQLNPTNGSSFWLTLVQTQQIASSQLRAIESGRWVLQAAPTGFSAIIEPDGTIVERSAISEARVIQGTVELREGNTWATQLLWYPMFIVALLAYATAWAVANRSGSDPKLGATSDVDGEGDRAVVDELDLHIGPEAAGLDGNAERL